MSEYADLIKSELACPRLPQLAKRYDKEQVSEAIMQSKGVMTIACNLLDCTYD